MPAVLRSSLWIHWDLNFHGAMACESAVQTFTMVVAHCVSRTSSSLYFAPLPCDEEEAGGRRMADARRGWYFEGT